MQNQSDSSFERYVREKMHALKRTPSDGLWGRIAARQKSAWYKQIFRNVLTRSGIALALTVVLVWAWKRQGEPVPEVMPDIAGIRPGIPLTPEIQSGISRFPYEVRDPETLLKSTATALSNRSLSVPSAQKAKHKNRKQSTSFSSGFPLGDEKNGFPLKNDADRSNEKAGDQASAPMEKMAPATTGNGTHTQTAVVENVRPDMLFIVPLHLPGRTLTVSNTWKNELQAFPRMPVYPLTRPCEARFQYGVSFQYGKLHETGNWNSNYFAAGLQFQYRLTNRLHLFGGLEWLQGNCRYDPVFTGSFAVFSKQQFPYLSPIPLGSPRPFDRPLQLQSHWSGLSLPLGATVYVESPFRQTRWLVRAYYKPQLALQRKNHVIAPFNGLADRFFEEKQQELRAGWIGAQIGLDFHALRRLRFELTLNAEHALQAVNLEQVNYQAFSIRLAAFRH